MKSVDAADYTIAVIGAGAMGQGIAQVAVQGGVKTLLFDAKPGGAAAGRDQIVKRIERLVEKDRISAEDARAASERLVVADDISALSGCDAVIEAVFENIDVKTDVFKQVEAVVSDDCIIASNTSSIPIASIAKACKKRDRVAGLHFFNPVPLMKLVEVIRASDTSDETVAALTALGKRMTRVPVTVADMPGFLVNMGGRAFSSEAFRILHEGVATPAQIDAVMRDCRHFRMGPFELGDLTGIDVNFPASRIIYDGYMQDPRIKTAPPHEAMFNSGRWGRKTSAGWYDYKDGKVDNPPLPDHETDAAPASKVSIAEPSEALADFCKSVGLEVLDEDDGDAPIVAAPVGDDATHTALMTDADYRRLVCIDLSCDTSKRVCIMTAPGVDEAARDAVAAAITASGRKVTAIKDSPGFIAQRMCAMIANLGCYMAEVNLATPSDIDLAMKLGLNYPHGPLELVEDLGTENTLEILERLQEITGEDRYRPTMWLRRRALLDLPIHTPA
ncbi:MAG: 3-hydroxyacyl-CoA dehydrogenase [Alphaproteobacteria bacterium]|nr:3-hydroxyacyl-CoA dehydrogenase [Alphaproteobacteria bacterium]